MIRVGRLRELIDGWNVTGLTSNPTTFEKALHDGDLSPALPEAQRTSGGVVPAWYRHLGESTTADEPAPHPGRPAPHRSRRRG